MRWLFDYFDKIIETFRNSSQVLFMATYEVLSYVVFNNRNVSSQFANPFIIPIIFFIWVDLSLWCPRILVLRQTSRLNESPGFYLLIARQEKVKKNCERNKK